MPPIATGPLANVAEAVIRAAWLDGMRTGLFVGVVGCILLYLLTRKDKTQ